MELVLVLPIVLILFSGIVEFSFLLYARGDVIQAARNGARLASVGTVSEESVTEEVRRTLGPRYGETVQVASLLGESSGDEVIVKVEVPMSVTAPNLLWPIGYDLRGRNLIAETRMLKE
ncbi:MAG: pilus assembly protein [Planctomycetaceae bacterium]|nr:pilus assembly protein [Planctomycetaceae bacterium]